MSLTSQKVLPSFSLSHISLVFVSFVFKIMSQLLSSGAIEAIYFDEVTNPLTKDPILQLINFRVVLLNGHVRYK